MAESCDNDVVVTVMEEYSGNPSHILIPIQMDLVANTNYCMSIFVDTIAGNSSINLNFGKHIILVYTEIMQFSLNRHSADPKDIS